MPGDPLRASFGNGGWRHDNAGLMAPVGGSAGEKELLRLPKELADLAVSANTLMRGRLARELWPDLALLSTIAPNHARTKLFIANVTAGSMGEDGAARREYLEGLARMLVPSWGPTPASPSKHGSNSKKQQKNNTEDDE